MKVTSTALPEVLVLEPDVLADERGWFMESWNARRFAEATGMGVTFVQDNHSYSRRHVLRGIHYQRVMPQGKLVRVLAGAALDVAVDLRRSSPNFARWMSIELSAENRKQLWIPPGFGHGVLARSDHVQVLYKVTEHWLAAHDCCVLWSDPALGIDWQLDGQVPILAPRDRDAPPLARAEVFD